jgi:hypothetical protein
MRSWLGRAWVGIVALVVLAAPAAIAGSPADLAPRLAVSGSAAPQVVGPGEPVALSATVVSEGRQPAREVRLTVTVPEGFTIRALSQGATVKGRSAVASRSTLPGGQELSLEVEVSGAEPGLWSIDLLAEAANVAPTGASVPVTIETTEVGPCLRFGVYPGNTFTVGKYVGLAGSEGRPIYGEEAFAAMEDLAGGRAFNIHFYASWRGGVDPGLAHVMRETAGRGFLVNLALKYLPPDGRDGDIEGFAAWVADVVRDHPEITTVQVTNEANSSASTDSDGGSTDPLGALIEGVKAAAAVKHPHQEIGFNWFYRLDPISDRGFWSTLGERGGQEFRDAVDWAGVNIYTGTYIPPVAIDDEASYRAALDYTRNEMMPLAGLGPEVPIYVQETGYPTLGEIRSEARQATAIAAYVRAAQDFNVGLLQWFQLADADSLVGDGWGLLRSDYSPKPAYDVLHHVVRAHAPC